MAIEAGLSLGWRAEDRVCAGFEALQFLELDFAEQPSYIDFGGLPGS